MNPEKRYSYFILIGIVFSMLCSCSRIKLAYNYADWLLARQARQYLSLPPEADDKLTQEIKAYHIWHRKEMLPVYASLCRKLAFGFRGQEKEEDNIRLVTPMLSGVWSDTVEPMIAPIAEALWSLDEKGITKLEKGYADDSVKQRKLYLENPGAADKRRADKTVDYVKTFAGALSDEQAKKIREITLSVHMPYEEWVTDRELRKRDLVGLLRARQSQKLIEAALRDWWLRSRISGARLEQGQMDVKEVKKFFLDIIELLTPEQRENAARLMETYAVQFDELARDVPGPQPRPLIPPVASPTPITATGKL